MPKKKWETPKLIVLVRGNSQEAVLGACKMGGEGSSANGPDSLNGYCGRLFEGVCATMCYEGGGGVS